MGKLGWDGAYWGVRNQLRQEPYLFHKYVLHTGDSVVKKDRQGPCLPRTHHLYGETHKYTTGSPIRAVKRQILGAGEPGRCLTQLGRSAQGRLPGGVDVYAKIRDE